ncbi:MAG: L-lactate dehydrogenase [Pseudomonadota bacterium]
MKVGIIGTGMVGSATANALVMRGAASEIVLIDANEARARAEAEDILHATPFAYITRVYAGTYKDLKDAGIIVIAAGVSQQPGETRLHLLERNAVVFDAIIRPALQVAPEAVLVIATNPVDIMTQIATRLSGLPASRVIGSGTILDTARFRALLGSHFDISPKSVHAHVLGEHGDSEVLCWSTADIGSIRIEEFGRQMERPLDDEVKARIDAGTRGAAYTIIAGKGATWYGIAGGLVRIIQSIVNNENSILTVSMLNRSVEGIDEVALSLPRAVGRHGVVDTLYPHMDQAEHQALKRSAEFLKDAMGGCW